MLELIVVDGRARGIIARDMVTGEIETHLADVVVLATRRLRQRLLPVHQRDGLQRHRDLAGAPQGRLLRQPLLHADPPDLHPGLRRPPVQADADVGVAAQRRPDLGAEEAARTARRTRARSPRTTATTTWSGSTRRFGNLVPRDIASRAAKNVCDEGRGVGPWSGTSGAASTSTSPTRSTRLGSDGGRGEVRQPLRHVRADHRREPVRGADADLPRRALHDGRPVGRLRPAVHIPGLFVTGEANFSDHGANRLGASALMQGLADGYFVLPNTIRDYLADGPFEKVAEDHPAVVEAQRVGARTGSTTSCPSTAPARVDSFHRELGHIMWEYCGMERTEDGPAQGDRPDPRAARTTSGATSRCSARPTASTSRWRRPAGWPTSSSSAS